jgi:hypothetical protein
MTESRITTNARITLPRHAEGGPALSAAIIQRAALGFSELTVESGSFDAADGLSGARA